MVVMAIIAVLLGLGITAITISQRSARDEARKVAASEIVSEINDHFRLNASYPEEGSSGQFQWGSDFVQIGSGGVDLIGSETYSSDSTDANQTRYVYIKDSTGFILCTLLEGGAWHKLGTGLATCPAL